MQIEESILRLPVDFFKTGKYFLESRLTRFVLSALKNIMSVDQLQNNFQKQIAKNIYLTML